MPNLVERRVREVRERDDRRNDPKLIQRVMAKRRRHVSLSQTTKCGAQEPAIKKARTATEGHPGSKRSTWKDQATGGFRGAANATEVTTVSIGCAADEDCGAGS